MAARLLALLDDIGTIRDDVALLTKLATTENRRSSRRRPGVEGSAGRRGETHPGAAGGVGSGILVHGAPLLHHALENLLQAVAAVKALPIAAVLLANAVVGIVAGAVALAALSALQQLQPRREA